MPPTPCPLLVIAGPTATGKTDLAARVAREAGGEVVSADAFGIYRGLEIGTAQPRPEDYPGVRFHLVGEREPDQPYSVADFQARATEVIAEIRARGRLPILCGGTGLYLRALLRGFHFPPPSEEGQQVRRRLEQEAAEQGPQALHRRLAQVDPRTAARLAPADRRRVIRALEVWELTGRPLAELASVDPSEGLGYNAARYLLVCPRELLRERIDRRVEQMLRVGWLQEAQALREAGLEADRQALRALGYRELYAVLEGRLSLPQAAERIRQQTRQFAKRQLTWFRREPGFTWLNWSTQADYEAFGAHLVAVGRSLREGRGGLTDR